MGELGNFSELVRNPIREKSISSLWTKVRWMDLSCSSRTLPISEVIEEVGIEERVIDYLQAGSLNIPTEIVWLALRIWRCVLIFHVTTSTLVLLIFWQRMSFRSSWPSHLDWRWPSCCPPPIWRWLPRSPVRIHRWNFLLALSALKLPNYRNWSGRDFAPISSRPTNGNRWSLLV